jgi:general secretion pathway protein E
MTFWEDMRVAPPVLGAILTWMSRPTGLLLVAGSTGSGKTTFVEALVHTLFRGRPTWRISDARQIDQLPSGAVVECGDIRLPEDARDTIQMAHKTLAIGTLRSGKFQGAVERLVDLEVTTQDIRAAQVLILTLHLVRVLCPRCRRPVRMNEKTRSALGMPADVAALTSAMVYEAVGCEHCDQGYSGRVPLIDARVVGDDLQSSVVADLKNDGFVKLLAGLIGLPELESFL